MTIARKPQRAGQSPIDVEALINRGGSPGGAAEHKLKPAVVPIVLRVPGDMLEQMEAALKSRPFKTPRHTWILEAIHEKLSREVSR